MNARMRLLFLTVFLFALSSIAMDLEKTEGYLLIFSVVHEYSCIKKPVQEDINDLDNAIKQELNNAFTSETCDTIRSSFVPPNNIGTTHAGYAINIIYKSRRVYQVEDWLVDHLGKLKTKNGFELQINRRYPLEEWPYRTNVTWLKLY